MDWQVNDLSTCGGSGSSSAAGSSKRKAPAKPKEPKLPKEPKEAPKRVRPSGGSSKKSGGKAAAAADSTKESAEGLVSNETRAMTPDESGKVDVVEGEEIGLAAKPDPSVGAQILVIHVGSSNLRIGEYWCLDPHPSTPLLRLL